MKITKYTEEYIRRFEKFLLDTPESKMKFLQDKFFRDLPKKQNGIFRKNDGSVISIAIHGRIERNSLLHY